MTTQTTTPNLSPEDEDGSDDFFDDETYVCDTCGDVAEPDWVERHVCYANWNGPLVGEAIKAADWSGIAWRVLHDNGEDAVIAVMVGDDREFRLDRDDVTVIDEDGYCAGCGQTGPPFCFGYGPQDD